MPIYEFYCDDCNIIFNFFSSLINTEKRPLCPRCKQRPLERIISRFAVLRGSKEKEDQGIPGLDETRLEKAMSMLEKEAGKMNEDDPRQAALLMRKLIDTTGLNLGSGMEEALRRMEAGEDPEKIEKEMGDLLDENEPFNLLKKTISKKGRKAPPQRDENLYIL